MVVFRKDRLEKFGRKHAAAHKPIHRWVEAAEAANWTSPADIKLYDPAASILGNGKVIFNLGGNNFRLFVLVSFAVGVVNVEWIGTHAEYDRMKF